jgi:hypothetical protein
MEGLLLLLIPLLLFRKKTTATTTQPSNSGGTTAPDFTTGRVKILNWPTERPKTIQEVQMLFYVSPNGRTIGPASACALPNKLQLKTSMISGIQRLSVLASQFNQMPQPQRDSDQGDRLRDEIEETKDIIDMSYRSLKQGCLNTPTQTGPITTAATQRMS